MKKVVSPNSNDPGGEAACCTYPIFDGPVAHAKGENDQLRHERQFFTHYIYCITAIRNTLMNTSFSGKEQACTEWITSLPVALLDRDVITMI